MEKLKEKTKILVEKTGLAYLPIAVILGSKKPEGAMSLKKAGTACIAPLIFAAAKGKTVAIDKDSTGYACSAFYLGYTNWIFNGIEYFLSNSPKPLESGRECERFVNSPAQAKEYVESFVPEIKREETFIFKPVENLTKGEKPEVVILFANPDQMSAIVFLLHYNSPNSFDRVVTGFASSCAAMTTFPLRYAQNGEKKAFWGLHDPAQRLSFPADITSMAMPFEMYEEICGYLEDSFLFTHPWQKVLNRISGIKAE